jgi:folate-dependent phosphoribosylglycinamide formyltransferase PurN
MKRHNDKRPWVAFFSQTGTEIRNLARDLDYWPDLIITNERPEDLRTINPKLIEEYPGEIIKVSNRPSDEELRAVLYGYYNPIITLHGWLRIMSPWMCENYDICNGHPGLITLYPELKGKDPQMRAWMGNYEWIGSVLHNVSEGVDEGRIIAQAAVRGEGLDMDGTFHILSKLSHGLWTAFLEKHLGS